MTQNQVLQLIQMLIFVGIAMAGTVPRAILSSICVNVQVP
jgi:hypothetical protein